jgi:hypothetical protein
MNISMSQEAVISMSQEAVQGFVGASHGSFSVQRNMDLGSFEVVECNTPTVILIGPALVLDKYHTSPGVLIGSTLVVHAPRRTWETVYEYRASQDECVESGMPAALKDLRGVRIDTPDRADTKSVLAQCPELLRVLTEASARIRTLFGEDAKLVLEVFRNPEAMNPDACLYLVIKTGLAPSEAGLLLDQLDEEWWLDTMPGTGGRLSITVAPLHG